MLLCGEGARLAAERLEELGGTRLGLRLDDPAYRLGQGPGRGWLVTDGRGALGEPIEARTGTVRAPAGRRRGGERSLRVSGPAPGRSWITGQDWWGWRSSDRGRRRRPAMHSEAVQIGVVDVDGRASVRGFSTSWSRR